MMKLPSLGVREDGEISRFRQSLMQPYNVSWFLVAWVLCNLGMAMPPLFIAVTAQVIMGTVFVYATKAATDLNLYYSMGDTEVFLTMQVYCKNVECFAGECIITYYYCNHITRVIPQQHKAMQPKLLRKCLQLECGGAQLMTPHASWESYDANGHSQPCLACRNARFCGGTLSKTAAFSRTTDASSAKHKAKPTC